MIGREIGSYRVLSLLGEGGMGTVYVGEHKLLGRRAAIKVLLPEMSVNQTIVNRFFNEARAVTSIADPGIVQVFDYGVHESTGCAFIVMELLNGETIEKRLERTGRMAPSDVLRLGRQISTSLAAAHAKGIVHRDLKPDNLFVIGDPAVTGGERAKILDFGIAKLSSTEPGANKTRTGMLIGTPVYMSPEQCRGAGDIDHRTDIYSLGCVLFKMLCGRPPFDSPGSGEVMAMHLREAPPPLSMFVSVAPEIEAVVMRCLAKNPAERPQTAVELANILGTIEFGQPFRTSMPNMPVVVDAVSGRIQMATPTPMPTPVPHNQVTTLQGAAGQSTGHPAHDPARSRRRTGVIIGVASALIAIGGITIIGVQTRGNKNAAAQPAEAPDERLPLRSGGGEATATVPPMTPPAATPPPAPPVAPPPAVVPAAPPAPPAAEPPPAAAATPPASTGSAAAPVATKAPVTTSKVSTSHHTTRPKPTEPTAKGSNAPRVDRGD